MKTNLAFVALLLPLFAAAYTVAQPLPSEHADHMSSGAMQATPEGAGSTQEFEKANQKMHAGMAMSFTGDADVDFVTGMIPHHQGAIDMAKVELKYGKDPEIRKLAEDIIKAQEDEISLMNAWLAKRKR